MAKPLPWHKVNEIHAYAKAIFLQTRVCLGKKTYICLCRGILLL